jgi:transposase
MNPVFKPLPAQQPSLFREDLFEQIPENHPVRLISQVVDALDISELMKEYKGGGASSFHPRMMLKVLFYAYFCNIYSCRRIAKALEENIYFIWISGNSKPDYRTINHFRGKRLKKYIHKLFAEVVRLLNEMGYVSFNVQYVDGTKIESAANRYTFVWRKSVEKNKEKLEIKIAAIIREIESQIKEDQREINKEETPIPINIEEIKKRVRELNEKIKEKEKEVEKANGKEKGSEGAEKEKKREQEKIIKEVKKKVREIEEKALPKLERCEEDLKVLGDRNSYSKTDKDATFMRMKEDHLGNGELKPSYNVQISTENQFITHYSIHQTPDDTRTLEKHLSSFEEAYKTQSKEVVADAGYGSEENYEMLEKKGIDPYVKYNYFHKEQSKKWKEDPFLVQNLYYNKEGDYYVCPMGQRMERVGEGINKTANGYEAKVVYYEAKRCEGCPLRGVCYKGDARKKRIAVNQNLNRHKEKVRALLNSEKGRYHRRQRNIEVEAVFGQLKSNNRFRRFTLRGMEKVNIEFGLMAIGHNLRKLAKKKGMTGDNDATNQYKNEQNFGIKIYDIQNLVGISVRLVA